MPTAQNILDRKGQDVATIAKSANVLEAATLMNQKRIGALVVRDGDRIVGIFTERDILNRVVAKEAGMFEANEAGGAEANMAKMLAADASWHSADMCVQTHGGFGFAEEYAIERKFRETRLYQVAPISTNLILSYIAEHVLGLPRSY